MTPLQTLSILWLIVGAMVVFIFINIDSYNPKIRFRPYIITLIWGAGIYLFFSATDLI